MKISLENAIEKILDNVEQVKETITVNINDAKSFILAKDVYSIINQPPFNRSPLDGYAVNSSDTKNASKENPIKLEVIDEVFAGDCPNVDGKVGCATRIMTGAPIPKGYDCIIKQENTDYRMDYVSIYESLSPYQNYCFEGEDSKIGTLILEKYKKLNFMHIGILASQGIMEVEVFRKPRVLFITTGNELISVEEKLQPGKIYNSNMYIIGERLKDLGVEVDYLCNKDDYIKLAQKIKDVHSKYDLILSTGGVSVGKKDILHDTLRELAIKQIFWKVDLKPGTPAMMSKYKDTPILSLSGNPFAALTTFELLARPLISKLANDSSLMVNKKTAILQDKFSKKSTTRRFIRAYYEDAKVYLPSENHSSGSISSTASCNCLIDIESGNQGLNEGQEVSVILL